MRFGKYPGSRRIILGGLVISVTWVSAAFALSDEQTAALSHVGQVMAGVRICDKIQAKQGAIALLLTFFEIDLKDPLQKALVESKIDDTVSVWAGRDADAACAAIMMLYGPDGQNVPGLVGWK